MSANQDLTEMLQVYLVDQRRHLIALLKSNERLLDMLKNQWYNIEDKPHFIVREIKSSR